MDMGFVKVAALSPVVEIANPKKNAQSALDEIYKVAEQIQKTLAILPDYAFKNSDAAAGTSVAGIAGGIIVVLLCVGGCLLFRLFRKKNINE